MDGGVASELAVAVDQRVAANRPLRESRLREHHVGMKVSRSSSKRPASKPR